jgi:hypothetical protein
VASGGDGVGDGEGVAVSAGSGKRVATVWASGTGVEVSDDEVWQAGNTIASHIARIKVWYFTSQSR